LGSPSNLQQFEKSVNETWLAPLKKPRGRFANVTVTVKHQRLLLAKLTTKQKRELKSELETMEWDQTWDINEYFTKMDEKQETLDG
jgi:hypothetical protein